MNTKLKEPLTANCLNCQTPLEVKYVRAINSYSQKNHLGYWTEAKEDCGYYTCDQCLFRLYHNYKWEFKRMIPNRKKQSLFRVYIYNGTIKGQLEPLFARKLDVNRAERERETKDAKNAKGIQQRFN
ncbi:MAG: hypothetical protein MRERV_25c034 [Mycoplasmataceae bacterium RV_VA103A]|nr:MAG: hypothetical protein MRERV_25c034 [Mycoplasmataceae bacterium RV_VA103A]